MKTKAHITGRGITRSIFLRLSFGAYEKVQPDEVYRNGRKYRRIEYYTGETIKPSEWNIQKGRAKRNSFLNGQIERGLLRMENIYSEYAYKGNIDFHALRDAIKTDSELSDIFNRQRVINAVSDYKPPFQFIEEYIQKANVSDGTKKDYTNTLTHLKNFDAYRGKTVSWKSMGYEYYMELISYLKSTGKKGSTIDKIIKNLKLFLAQADLDDNINVNQDFRKIVSGRSLFAKVDKEEAEHVYLDEDEIKQITDAALDNRLGEIRDLFIIGCWTGLRISDLSRLKSENISDGLLRIKAQKTKHEVIIPVTDELQRVLDKYPDRLPKTLTDQYYNRQLKEVAKQAGITEPVMAEVKRGGMTVTMQVPKYELVTRHTARRSFATNLYRRGIPSSQLMFLTGHKTEDAFLRYIRVSKEDNARDVSKKLKRIG
jgi:integrase